MKAHACAASRLHFKGRTLGDLHGGISGVWGREMVRCSCFVPESEVLP